MKLQFLVAFIFLCFVSVQAETLSLKEVLERAAEANPSLRKVYAQVKAADADLHQAYLLQNPDLEARVLWPRGGSAPLQEYGISYNIIDLFQRGARIDINKKRRDATLLQAMRRAVEIEKDLKTAYYTVQGHSQGLQEQKVLLEIAEIDAELADRQYKAGNIPAIEMAEKKAALLQMRTLVYNRQLALFEARQELSKLLGRASEISQIAVEEGPPELPPESQKTGPTLFAEALLQRHDFQSLDLEIAALRTDRFRQNVLMFDETRLGFDYERETDGQSLQGLSLSMPLPIFDQRQAVKERLDALVEEQQAGRAELSQDIAAEINMSLVRMANARLRVEQLEELVPLRQEILKLSRQQYNAMLIGAYQLLDFRGQGSVALMTLADAKADYWRAHAELEEALGKSILAGTVPFEIIGEKK